MDLQGLEADLMDTMNDHIRLINFGFGGKVDIINPHLRSVDNYCLCHCITMHVLILSHCFSALQELYTFRAYVSHMNTKRSLGRELEKCIEPSVNSWFERLKATVMPKRGVSVHSDITVLAMTGVLLDFSMNRKSLEICVLTASHGVKRS